jgi:hypothetical protein
MKRVFLAALLAAVAASSAGCGRPFHIKTAPGFVELENQEPQYSYRAVAPEGVVMGVRVVEIGEHGDLAFWERAVTLRMRQLDGYALLGASDATALDGTKGRELDFGHDESGKPFAYRVRLFIAQDRLFIAEAGGSKENMDRYKQSVDWMLTSLEVKCGGFLAPVLSSHTCNRW